MTRQTHLCSYVLYLPRHSQTAIFRISRKVCVSARRCLYRRGSSFALTTKSDVRIYGDRLLLSFSLSALQAMPQLYIVLGIDRIDAYPPESVNLGRALLCVGAAILSFAKSKASRNSLPLSLSMCDGGCSYTCIYTRWLPFFLTLAAMRLRSIGEIELWWEEKIVWPYIYFRIRVNWKSIFYKSLIW